MSKQDIENGSSHTCDTYGTHDTYGTYSIYCSFDKDIQDIQEAKTKNAFIAKIYSILTIQLITTLTMSYLFYTNAKLTTFVLKNTGLLVTTTLFTFLFLILSWFYGKTSPANYFILAGFTLCEAYSVSYISLYYDPTSIMLAWGLTATTFINLTIYVLVTKKDFNYLGAGLATSLWIVIAGSLIQIIWLPNDMYLRTSMAVLGSLIACGYILYDTSDIVNRLEPDEFVYACMGLYLDIIMLFVRLLELFGTERK